MARRHDELIAELRTLLLAALKKAKGNHNTVVDELLGDHRTGLWPDIEHYGSASWMIGKYEGHVEGLRAARNKLLAQAADLFTVGKDTEAFAVRKLADSLVADITAAEAEAARQRKERRD